MPLLPRPLAGMAVALLLATLAFAPTSGALAWLSGGHATPEDLSRHALLVSLYPQALHHGAPATSTGSAAARGPADSQANGLAFALGNSTASLFFSGLAAVLPAAVLVFWRAGRRALPRHLLFAPAEHSPLPLAPPPR